VRFGCGRAFNDEVGDGLMPSDSKYDYLFEWAMLMTVRKLKVCTRRTTNNARYVK